ncbi:excisionase [Paramagnetospirillum caucaseum]|uniref:Excisionase n=1 Tax=Paramagnetospirillum caucaseum TaxID=1244869 RepID=M3A886_9PROT|nr:helix-turn-helix domain-containing protein [Paramagnetospirillum caucaseum]EME68719.1 excisionase [Paramagnetospirillum caucaseum]
MKFNEITKEKPGSLSVNDFCRWAGIGRTAAYAEMKAGRLTARKFGRRTFIPMVEAERWLNSLPPQRT